MIPRMNPQSSRPSGRPCGCAFPVSAAGARRCTYARRIPSLPRDPRTTIVTSRTQIETGISQVTALLSAVTADERASATPCTDWTVSELSDHLVNTAANLVTMARGGEIDWSASPEPSSDPIPLWTERTRELLAEIDAGSPLPLGMVAAEFSVHAWDLATALGRGTDDFDPTVAEDGLEFMSENLTDERRAGAFEPEQPTPDGSNAYERLAAFAGRTVARS
ncbi:hypothetical protein CH294_10905 [Rhodococcus sp. 14-2483-1-1]|nr:hypothetical protein CH294_10905 [Rhodococcus sp. 14-2483-1-1]